MLAGSQKRRSIIAALGGSGLFLSSFALTATAAPDEQQVSGHDLVNQYMIEHPGDYAGLQDLLERPELSGVDVRVTLDGYEGTYSPEEAVELSNDRDAAFDKPIGEGDPSVDNYPFDAFTVDLLVTTSETGTAVTGSWHFRDDWNGVVAPYDVAALAFSSECVTYGSYQASTTSYSGVSTNEAVLGSSGVGESGPHWYVNDHHLSGDNQVHRGAVQVGVDTSDCSGTVQAAMLYEANQGGSMISVSVAWGGLSVSYDGQSMSLEKSSPAQRVP